MAGFDNDVLYADNVDFTGGTPVSGKVTTAGQLLIGASSSPYIRVNTLTAGTGIQITNGDGSITITNTGGGGGGGGVTSLAGDTGSATESGGVINVFGDTGITTTGDGLQTLTIAPANDLAAVEALSGTGIATRIASETWTTRTITAGSGISVSNGDGVAGNPTISAGATVATTYTADAGSATPAANNLNVLGGTGIDTSGAGSTLTLTFDVTEVATIATTYACDAGSATPAANTLTVTGGTGCATSGAGSTVTVNVDATVPLSFPTDSGTATPAANALTIAGGTGCSTTGAGSTVTVNVDATVPLSFATDSGTATPAANTITIAGGSNGIDTVGAGSTVTLNFDVTEQPTIPTSVGTDSGTATPALNTFNIIGGEGIDTSGSGTNVTISGENASDTNKGIASFDSGDFTVTNGNVTLNDTAIIQTITGDSGGALSPTAGNFNILGRSGSKTSGSGSTLTVKSPPYAAQGLTGASSLNSGEFVTASVTRTLPATAGITDGELVEFICTTANPLVIAANTGQTIRVGTLVSSSAGNVTSTAIGDSLSLRFYAAGTVWLATSVIGTWSIA